jgi:hypothetical protein
MAVGIGGASYHFLDSKEQYCEAAAHPAIGQAILQPIQR